MTESPVVADTDRDSLSERTIALLSAFAPHTGLSSQEILQDGVRSYVRFLTATYGYMRASVPLMEDARATYLQTAGSEKIVHYLNSHIDEETDHDSWLLEDIRSCGTAERECHTSVPPEISAAVGAQYYHIRHGNPHLLFAYIFALESFPPDPGLIDDILAVSEIPSAAVRTLRDHQDLDTGQDGHAAQLGRLIDSLELCRADELAFLHNALATATQIHVGVRKALRGTYAS